MTRQYPRPDLDVTIRAGVPRSRPASSPIAEAARCPTRGCGRPHKGHDGMLEFPLDGEVVVHVAGSGDGARIYCGGSCASRGIARVELHHHLPPDQRPRDLQTVATLPVHAPTPTLEGYRTGGPGSAGQQRKARLERAGATTTEVRTWAWANGVTCGQKGVPSESVVDAFLAARERASA